MNLSKYPALALLAGWGFSSAVAHDAWIEAKPAGNQTQIDVFVGHAEDRSHYDLEAARVSGFYSLGPDGVSDQSAALNVKPAWDGLTVPVQPGQTTILALTTFRATSTLPAQKFNEYLVEEGITPILQHRLEHGEINEDGREVYSRFLKALVPSTETDCSTNEIGNPLGHILEIIPVTNPGKDCSGPLEFELRYFGKTVEGATLHFNRTDAAMEPVKAQTGPDGRASFERPTEGVWYVHAAWSMPIDAERFGADFATSFASLSFALAD